MDKKWCLTTTHPIRTFCYLSHCTWKEAIWRERNLIFHNNGDRRVVTIFCSLFVQLQSYKLVLSKDHDHDQFSVHLACWLPPPSPWIKINLGATVREEVVIAAMVAWDDHCRVLDARTSIVQLTDLLVAKAATILLGSHLAREQLILAEGGN
ncbi:hypothetical protein PanWU01x14_059640 [Parasponia andersonii]|uniref:RNase H type-1 domain-containing protein n=1 Tax=Parasponia andersonii TaxID=3476 RepID=A0A2P5DIM1_PARAD|nr:hypothetical protein PanWU01x14_059640 [Parasponia andersonii]